MKPLLLLVIAFAITSLLTKLSTGSWSFVFSGNLAMFLMLCLTAIGHFKFSTGMTMMMPGFMPFKKELVYFTGIMEILLGLCLLFPQLRLAAGIILVILFVVMLPANINAAIRHINYEKATYDGSGLRYLWFRVPLQVFFIAWVIYFSVRK